MTWFLSPCSRLLCRGLRDYEEHRRGHPVFALNQHRPSGCQGTSCLYCPPSPQRRGPRGRGGQGHCGPRKGPRVVLCPRGLAPVAELAGHLSAPQALPSGQTPLRPGSLLRPCSSVTPTAPPLVCVPVVLTLSLHQCFTPTPAVSPGGAGAEGPDGVWIIGARQTVAEWGREEREESFPCRFLTAAHRFSRDTPCLSLSLAREPFIHLQKAQRHSQTY